MWLLVIAVIGNLVPFMSGNGGNYVVYVPSQSLVAVVTRTHYSQRGMHQQTVRLLEENVLAALPCAGA